MTTSGPRQLPVQQPAELLAVWLARGSQVVLAKQVAAWCLGAWLCWYWSRSPSKGRVIGSVKSLQNNKAWELTMLPPGKKAISCKWVYKVKTNNDGSIECYKARLVARGFDQKFSSDYDETLCPLVHLESLRTLIALSTQRGLELHHVDVATAFLNGTLQKEIYMEQPTRFEKEGEEHLVCRLRKSIYGLKQSFRCRNIALNTHLRNMGFSQSKSDPCIYVSGAEDTSTLECMWMTWSWLERMKQK